nr:IucA/IucC family protein [Glycomyces tenuis]
MTGPTEHLRPEHWRRATKALLAKAIGEFAHERLLAPAQVGDYCVLASGGERYLFKAERLALDHWAVDPESLWRRGEDGEELPLDAARFFIAFKDELGLSEEILPVYLEEIASTVNRGAYQLAVPQPSAAELVDADFQEVEAAMTGGHPCFVAGSGRLGFTSDDYLAFAPETGAGVRLLWLAALRRHAMFASSAELPGDWLLETQLDSEARDRFALVLAGRGLTFGDVHLIPVHPWQWRNKISTTFAAELAEGRLVVLGETRDEYQAQQSIRTFFNRSRPEADYVKTALSVLNMGFMRGLSTEYMEVTPAINDFIADLVHGDPTLKQSGVTVLRERASVGYRHPAYSVGAPKGSPYRKMLAALWRESPVPHLERGERAVTMASLLHVDASGRPFVSALIARAKQAPEEWLRRYLEAYLVPLVHCFYKYGLAFMPHGENVILGLRYGRVSRVFLKDIGEEAAIFDESVPVPPEAERIKGPIPDEVRTLAILTDVVDCFLRFLSAILHGDGVLDERDFWRTAAEVIKRYQAAHPELAERFARFDLFEETFGLSCLNRLQLKNNRQMVNLENQEESLIYAGRLDNPLAPWRDRLRWMPSHKSHCGASYAPMMRPLIGAAAALLLLAAGACTDGGEPRPAAAECETGEFTVVDEEPLGEYAYSLSFPCPEGEAELATVIVLHGWPGSGWGMRTASNMDVLAEREGFMAVYPSEPNEQWDASADGDDASFLSDLIDTLVEHWSADPERIHLAGISNGGDMTLAASAVLSGEVAAIAPLVPAGTGGVYEAVEGLEAPVPMVALVGEDDSLYLESGMQGLELWFEAGGCSSDGVVEETEGYTAESWTCEGGVPALLYRVQGGHQWFGSPDRPEPVWASRAMWDFFAGLE